MIIVSYDFTDNKIRTKFSKFLSKYGRRMQYSVFTIKNSPRVLNNIMTEVEKTYKKKFKNKDSVVLFKVCVGCSPKVKRYGYAKHDEKDVVYF